MSTYVNFDKLDKKGCLFNSLISARSGGKTFSMKLRMIDRFINHGDKFVYLRRRQKEIENKKMEMFFDKIQSEGYYTDISLRFDKGFFLIGDEVAGYATSLSTSVNERSVDFVGVKDIYFEEFVIKEDGIHKYLDDEVFKFLELYVTIARNDDVRVWFIGNKIHEFNPYFLYFDIRPPKDGIKVWNDFAVQIWNDSNFVEEKQNSRFGKLVSGTSYADYAINNQSYEENESFIMPLPKRSIPFFNIMFNGKVYSVMRSPQNTLHIVGYNVPTNLCIAYDSADQTPNIFSVNYLKGTWHGKNYINCLRHNMVYYDSAKTEELGRNFNKKIYFIK